MYVNITADIVDSLIYHRLQPCAESCYRKNLANRGRRQSLQVNCKRIRLHNKLPKLKDIRPNMLSLHNQYDVLDLVFVDHGAGKSFLMAKYYYC